MLQATLYNPNTGLPESRLLFEYQDFWTNLFASVDAEWTHVLYDELNRCILGLFSELNLSYHFTGEGDDSKLPKVDELQVCVDCE